LTWTDVQELSKTLLPLLIFVGVVMTFSRWLRTLDDKKTVSKWNEQIAELKRHNEVLEKLLAALVERDGKR